MASKKHLHGSRREHLVNKRRFTALNVVLAMVAVVAGYWVYSTTFAASSVTVKGRVIFNGVGVASLPVECGTGTPAPVNTDSGGYYKCSVASKAGYHVRILPGYIPDGATGGPTKKRSEVSSATTYEWQQSASDCYHAGSGNPDGCYNYKNGIYSAEQIWDQATDIGLDFKFTYNYNWKVSGKVTLDGTGRSGVSLNCNGKIVVTGSSGIFECTANGNGDYYEVRYVSGLPSNAIGGATKNNPEHASSKSYENQYPGINCYKNPSCNSLSRASDVMTWDRTDSGFDFAYSTPAAPKPQCSDGKDNDGDGKIDSADAGCSSPSDTTESPNPSVATQCADGKDNDGDGKIDFGKDPGCSSAGDTTESPNPTVPAPPGVKPSTPDSTAPSAPENLLASLTSDKSNVRLTWGASKDSSGIKNYVIQRSKDKNLWETLSDKVTGTNYTDARTDYKTAYFYRVKAVDNAGNSSGYATAEITTGEFKATEEGTTIQSDDGVAQVTIPDGALGEDASCSIVANEDNTDSLGGTKLELVYGPYELSCKKVDGDFITSFAKPVEIRLLPKDDAIKDYKNLVVFKLNPDTNEWEAAEITTGEEDGKTVLSFTTDKPLQFAVVGERKPGLPWGIISFIILLILAAIAVFIYLLRKAQKEHYQDYLRRKYYNL